MQKKIMKMGKFPAVHDPATLAALEEICRNGPQSVQDLFILRNHWNDETPFLRRKP